MGLENPLHGQSAAFDVIEQEVDGLAPVQPSIVDLDAVDATADVCRLAGVPVLFVLNRVPTQGQEVVGTENAIRKRGMLVAQTRWGERKAFKYPFMRGLVAQEAEPDSKAAGEVRALFDELNMPAGTHVRRRTGGKGVDDGTQELV